MQLVDWLCRLARQRSAGGSFGPEVRVVAHVRIDRAGRFNLNGRTASLAELKAEFARLRKVGGMVVYTRGDTGVAETPTHRAAVVSVIKAIAAERLPINFQTEGGI